MQNKKSKTYSFTLVLKNVDEDTLNLEDSLYEAGCDDAIVNYRNGAVYLEFDRDSTSIEEAVMTAIKDIRSASIEIEVASVSPSNFVTESEMAKRLGVSRQTVSLWIKGKRRREFPHPIMGLSEKSPLWDWSAVAQWLLKNEIIDDKELVSSAIFFANINGALEERDKKVRKIRNNLLARMSI